MRAAFDFHTTGEAGELMFRKDELITIVSAVDGSLWWEGRIEGAGAGCPPEPARQGVFPANFVVRTDFADGFVFDLLLLLIYLFCLCFLPSLFLTLAYSLFQEAHVLDFSLLHIYMYLCMPFECT